MAAVTLALYPFPNDKFLDWTKLKKAIADDKFNIAKMRICVFVGVEHMGKGGNAGYQNVFTGLFPQGR